MGTSGKRRVLPVKNTAIKYKYRDASNNKVAATVIFAGRLSTAQTEAFLASLSQDGSNGEGDFIPGQVGLKDLQNSFHDMPKAMLQSALENETHPPQIERLEAGLADIDENPCRWDPDGDHVWHELDEIDFTDADPTDARTMEAFAAEVAAVEWDPSYEPPFYDEMVKNYQDYLDRKNSDEPGM